MENNNLTKANEAKAAKALQKLISYKGNTITRAEWLEMMKNKGATTKEAFKCKTQWNRTKFNRLTGAEQAEYERKLSEKTVCYELHLLEGSFYDIDKFEFDYFNRL